MTRDGENRTFTYDGENKQVLGVQPEQQRDGGNDLVYDASGKLIEEYSTVVATLQTAEVAYLTNDHLGSPRINTDRDGKVISRHDYHPFGEDILTGVRTIHY